MNKTISRRVFVKTMAGTVMGCACFQMSCFAADGLISGDSSGQNQNVTVTGTDKEKLVAVCGLYCGACPVYIATQTKDKEKQKTLLEQFSAGAMQRKTEDLFCDGCLGGGRLFPNCRSCAIRVCPADKQSVTYCSDCKDFPCSQITSLNNRGLPHLREVLPNLEKIHEMGIQKWADYEEKRWQCPKCRSPIAWYDAECLNCGEPRSERLFPVPRIGKQP